MPPVSIRSLAGRIHGGMRRVAQAVEIRLLLCRGEGPWSGPTRVDDLFQRSESGRFRLVSWRAAFPVGSTAVPGTIRSEWGMVEGRTIRACYWIKQTENVGGGGGQISAQCG